MMLHNKRIDRLLTEVTAMANPNSLDEDAFRLYREELGITEEAYENASLTDKSGLRNNFDDWKEKKNSKRRPDDIQSIVDLSVAKAIKLTASTRPGTRTNAQFYQDLKSENKIESSGDQFPFPSSSSVWNDAWYDVVEPTYPSEDSNESGNNGTQAFFDGQMAAINLVISQNKGKLPVRKVHQRDESKFLNKPASFQPVTSIPQVFAHNTPAFNRRKFDGYTTQCGRAGPLSIMFPTELKGALPHHRAFPDDQAGQILDMVTQLMEYEQRNRTFMFAGLTDGYRWMFFKIIRFGTAYQYQQSTVYQGLSGWRHFLGMLCAPLHELGAVTPEVSMAGLRDITLEHVLGKGSSSVVYQSKIKKDMSDGDSDELALVKVYNSAHLTTRESEATALSTLANAKVDNVPVLILEGMGTSKYPNVASSENILIVQPVGLPVLPVKGGRGVRGKHLSQLISILQQAHAAGLQHRDIKPENIYLVDDSLLLNDWGSACPLQCDDQTWQGTPGFCDPPTFAGNGKVRDLRSAVRAAWAMSRNQYPLTDEDEPGFWNFLENSEEKSVWTQAWTHANVENYEELSKALSFSI